MVFGFFRDRTNRRLIDRIHGEIMTAARQPSLYLDYGIADTLEGRFELFTAMAALTIRRLEMADEPGPSLAQDLTDAVFRHFDAALREMGVGDITVPKRIKKLAENFLGRSVAYRAALASDDPALYMQALARNVQGLAEPDSNSERLARFFRAADKMLAETPLARFEQGPVVFPDAQMIS